MAMLEKEEKRKKANNNNDKGKYPQACLRYERCARSLLLELGSVVRSTRVET